MCVLLFRTAEYKFSYVKVHKSGACLSALVGIRHAGVEVNGLRCTL